MSLKKFFSRNNKTLWHIGIIALVVVLYVVFLHPGSVFSDLTYVADDIPGDTNNSYSAVMGDLDGDGDLDIYTLNQAQQNKVWINDGSGNFTSKDIPGDTDNSNHALLEDFDGDGDLDIYVVNYNGGQNRLWMNDGNANFTANHIPGDSGGRANYASAGDLDGDGDIDIYLSRGLNEQSKVWLNDGNANFTANDILGDTSNSVGTALGDVDGDGDLDIYVTSDKQNKLWLNDGNANFTANNIPGDSGITSNRAVMSDIDGDGDLDIYTSLQSTLEANRLWINDGSGNFTLRHIPGDFGGSLDVEASDIDGDGDIDLYVVNVTGQNRLWINDGLGNFTSNDIPGDLGRSIGSDIGDVNGDGKLDIYVANAFGDQNKLWTNKGVVPDLISVTPSDDSTHVSVDTDLTMVFDESIAVGTGKLVIYRSDGVVIETVDVASGQMTGWGTDTVVVDTASDLAYETAYYIQIDPGAFVSSTTGAGFLGIGDTTTWNFSTDTPKITPITPPDDATGVSVETDLTMRFDETVNVGAGNLAIYKTNGTLVEIINVTSNRVTGGGSRTIVVDPINVLDSMTSYYVLIASGAFESVASGNDFLGITNPTTWNFTTDNSNLIAFTPPDDSTHISIETDLTIEFDTVVTAGAGSISIYTSDGTLVEFVNINSDQISGLGTANIVIDLIDDLEYDTSYYVNIEPGTFTEWLGSIENSTTWNFSTDTPKIIQLNPLDDTYNLHPNSAYGLNPRFRFDEPVNIGSGTITIYHESDNSIFEVFDVTSDRVTGGGTNTITIDPINHFAADTKYYVKMDPGTFESVASGNDFLGINDDVTWNFGFNPVIMTPITPPNVSRGVDLNTDFVMEFNVDEVEIGTGNFTIYDYSDDSMVLTVDITSDLVSGEGTNTITVNPIENLSYDTLYYIVLDPGAIVGATVPMGKNLNEWRFDTDTPQLTPITPPDDSTHVSIETDLVMLFNEPVINIGTGSLVVYDASDDSIVATVDVTSGQVTGGGTNTISVDLIDNLEYDTSYYVQIDPGSFNGVQSYRDPSVTIESDFLGILDKTTWNFSTDTPQLTPITPPDDAEGVALDTNLVAEFDRQIRLGTGNITLYTSEGVLVEAFDVVLSNRVTRSGRTITIDPTESLIGNTSYYVYMDSGTYESYESRNDFLGIDDPSFWNFSTAPASVVAYTPEDDSVDVPVDTNLIMEFDQIINIGTGNFVIYKAEDGSVVTTIDVTSDLVTGGGTNIITIDPVDNLEPFTEYYVLIDPTAFIGYPGIVDDPTVWNFTTAPISVAFTPEDDSIDVAIETDLIMEFNQVVNIGTGNLMLYMFDGTLVETFDVTGDRVIGGGTTTITVDPTEDLLYETQYYALLDDSAIVEYAGIVESTTWNFTTIESPAFIGDPIDGHLGTSYDVSIADLDGDGINDIYVTNGRFANEQNKLWINDGAANLSSNDIIGNNVSDFGASRNVATGDLDGDGDLEIVVAENFPYYKYWMNDGSSNFESRTLPTPFGFNAQSVAIADFNNDGANDVYLAMGGMQNILNINNGDGTFITKNIAGDFGASFDAVAGDINGDGHIDIYVANSGSQNKLWINDGNANFVAKDIPEDMGQSFDVEMLDVENDGDLDLYVANVDGQNRLWINNGRGSFIANDIPGDTRSSSGIAVGDLDQDGYIDIYVTNLADQQNNVWMNNGDLTFTADDIIGDFGISWNADMGDVNSDGYPDIYVANDGENKLWLSNPLPLLIEAFTPPDDSKDVAIDTDLTITFNQPVTIGTGTIEVYMSDGTFGTLIATVDVASDQVVGDGTETLTIDLLDDLAYETDYYIFIDPTAIEDYPGIDVPTLWNFTTIAAPDPDPEPDPEPDPDPDIEDEEDTTRGRVTARCYALTASESSVAPGEKVVLSWETNIDAGEYRRAFINPVNSVDGDMGSIVVHPTSTTTYEAEFRGRGMSGTATCSVTVTVEESEIDDPLYGCTNELAINYDEDAKRPDGSCVYQGDQYQSEGDNDSNGDSNDDSGGDTDPYAYLSDELYTVAEDEEYVVIEVSRGGNPNKELYATLVLNDISAQQGVDYEALEKYELYWAADDVAPRRITLGVIDNDIVDGTRNLAAVLGQRSVDIDLPTDALVFIRDNDGLAGPTTTGIAAFFLVLFGTTLPLRTRNILLAIPAYRRRHRPWGTVYDTQTKQPLDSAYVQIIDENGKEVATSITDLAGRYGFLVEPGIYYIKAGKTNHVFPSKYLNNQTEDNLYSNLYFGEQIEVTEKGQVIARDIPMDVITDPVERDERITFTEKIQRFFRSHDGLAHRIIDILFYLGLAFSIYATIASPVVYNFIVLGLYALVLLIIIIEKMARSYGTITDQHNNPIPGAIVCAYNVNLNKEIAHRVTNQNGTYFMLVQNGEYYLTVEVPTETGEMKHVFTSEPFSVRNGIIKVQIQV